MMPSERLRRIEQRQVAEENARVTGDDGRAPMAMLTDLGRRLAAAEMDGAATDATLSRVCGAIGGAMPPALSIEQRLTLIEQGDQGGVVVTTANGTVAVVFSPPLKSLRDLQVTARDSVVEGVGAQVVSITTAGTLVTGAVVRGNRSGVTGALTLANILTILSNLIFFRAAGAGLTIYWRAKGVPHLETT